MHLSGEHPCRVWGGYDTLGDSSEQAQFPSALSQLILGTLPKQQSPCSITTGWRGAGEEHH